MAKTIKGLTTAAKKARARFEAWQDRYYALLGKFYLVNGNPAREWIVGSSWTLLDEFSEDDLCDGEVYLFGKTYENLSDYLIAEDVRIWRKVWRGMFGAFQWWAGCTAYVLRRMKTIERRMKYWRDKAEAFESALDDALYDEDAARRAAEFDAMLEGMSIEELQALQAQYEA